jgi:hypothetical protein
MNLIQHLVIACILIQGGDKACMENKSSNRSIDTYERGAGRIQTATFAMG